MIGKILVSLASLLLVAGIAIGVVAVIREGREDPLSNQTRVVQAFCGPATDKNACVKTVENVESDDPGDLLEALLYATKEAVTKAHNFTDEAEDKLKDDESATTRVSLDYCKRVFDYAIQDFETFMDALGKHSSNIKSDKFFQLRQWLTNVYVYQHDCLDDIEQEDLRETMAEGTSDARTLTSNAIDIFNQISKVIAALGLHVDSPADQSVSSSGASRHLLEDTTGGFPNWMSGADRKLLQKDARGGANKARIRPHFVVAKDGSGDFETVSKAVSACPESSPDRCIIYIKAGIYPEQVVIPKKTKNVFMYGDGARKTVISYNKSVKLSPGTTTSTSGTVQVESEGFMAKWIGFKNTAGPGGHQAVALRVNGDRAVIFNCRMDGYQDTLYVDSGRQFYRNCVISGTIDFIFGMSATVIQNSLIVVRKGNNGQFNTVTADGNDKGPALNIGIVLQNCRIVPDTKLAADKFRVKSYLGRPWKAHSTTIVMNSEIGDFIRPEGWMLWEGENFHETCTYREFDNRGPGARNDMRVRWKGFKVARSPKEVLKYTAGVFLRPANWISAAGVPMQLGLKA